MGAGLDDDGRKELRSGQYSDWGRGVSRTGLWWDGFMPVPDWLPAAYVFWPSLQPALHYVQISGTGCPTDRMTLPHQQATELGHSVPVTKGTDPFILVREWQSEAPHCGSHAAYRKLSPWSPPPSPRSRYYCVPLATILTILATAHLASHTQAQR